MYKASRARYAQALFAGILLCWVIFNSQTAVQAAAQAVERCAGVVFPSLFPFFVLSNLLVRSGVLRLRRGSKITRALFGVPAAGLSACLMGFCGGYPLGVSAACNLYTGGQLSRPQAERLLLFCNNTGPAFLFGMIGAASFPDVRICAALYAVHVLSALLCGLLLQRLHGARPETTPAPAASGGSCDLPGAIRDAFYAALQICGFVVFFAVLLQAALHAGPVRQLLDGIARRTGCSTAALQAAFSALLDLPSGVWASAQLQPLSLRFLLCACGVNWGGLCVYLQAMAIWRAAGLQAAGYLRAKLLQTALSALLSLPACALLFGELLPVPWLVAGALLAALPAALPGRRTASARRGPELS